VSAGGWLGTPDRHEAISGQERGPADGRMVPAGRGGCHSRPCCTAQRMGSSAQGGDARMERRPSPALPLVSAIRKKARRGKGNGPGRGISKHHRHGAPQHRADQAGTGNSAPRRSSRWTLSCCPAQRSGDARAILASVIADRGTTWVPLINDESLRSGKGRGYATEPDVAPDDPAPARTPRRFRLAELCGS